jgi:two-component system, OmpR family, response regulator
VFLASRCHACVVNSRVARILVIEDEPGVRTLVCRMLADAGHDVLGASDALSAFELLRGAQVVIGDMTLGGDDGITVLLAIRLTFPRLPLIVISGRDRGEIADRLASSGLRSAVWLLSKPFAPDELLSTLSAALIAS